MSRPRSRTGAAHSKSLFFSKRAISDGPRDLTAAEAAGARINVLRGTVDDGLDALHIGFPGAVGPSVRVGNLNSESDTLAADFTFSHYIYTVLPIKLFN